MLDLNHPNTPHTFAASRADDALLSITKKITLLLPPQRLNALGKSEPHFQQLVAAAVAIGHGESISGIVDNYRKALTNLANQPVKADRPAEKPGDPCPACGSLVKDIAPYDLDVYCPNCLKVCEASRNSIDELFGLWAI